MVATLEVRCPSCGSIGFDDRLREGAQGVVTCPDCNLSIDELLADALIAEEARSRFDRALRKHEPWRVAPLTTPQAMMERLNMAIEADTGLSHEQKHAQVLSLRQVTFEEQMELGRNWVVDAVAHLGPGMLEFIDELEERFGASFDIDWSA